MNYLLDVFRILAFRVRALRALSGRHAVFAGIVTLALGFAAYVLVRSIVYAALLHAPYVEEPPNALEVFLDSNLLQTVLFLTLVYVPGIIVLSNAVAGDGLGFSISRAEITGHLSALLPMWGILFLVAAPIQWIAPQFLMLSVLDISIGMLWLLISLAVYTVWAIRELNYLSGTAAFGVFALSWLTLPLFFLLTNVLLALPLFLVLPVLLLFILKVRELLATRALLRGFRQHLQTLMKNPRDADAHYQLGLLHFRSGHYETARGYFEQAIAIDPLDADFHYYMGRIFEAGEDWEKAAEEYEETYRLNPEFAAGDIFREVGKGYLHTGRIEKAVEFLRFYLERRGSDPEGRYWLAVALSKAGNMDEMRSHLNMVLDQARTNPRFFRRQHRAWIYRSRLLLHAAAD